jgi:hypothetical protein
MKGTAVELVFCILFFGVLAALLAVMYYLERSLDAPVSTPVSQRPLQARRLTEGSPVPPLTVTSSVDVEDGLATDAAVK